MAKNRNKKQKKQQNNPSNNNAPLLLDYDKAIKDARAVVKSLDKKILNSVPKGTQYDWLNNSNFNNIVYPKDKIPDRMLRLIERRNGIVAAVITLRIQQAMEFSAVSHDRGIPGWEFVLKDEKETLTKSREKEKDFLEKFIQKTQRDDYTGLQLKHDDLKDLLIKYVRDRILIDKITWEIERDKKGIAAALWVLDGATILPVLPGGFYGSTSQIGVGISAGPNKLSEEIRKARLENVPPVEEIAYVQELIYGMSGGGISAAFRENDIIYDLGNELNDIRYYKQGMSVVEKANVAVTAFINALTFNSNGLSRGAVPKVAIALGKDASFTSEQLEDVQDEWAANFAAMDGQWQIPLLSSDAKVLNLLPNNREMEYQKYMEFTGALTCAIMGVDSAEIGLRLAQAQNVLSENQDAKQVFSKNRGIKELLGGFAYIINKFMTISGFPFADDWTFRFNGIETEDKGFEADLRKKAVESIKTIDEVRAEIDLPPLPDGLGEIILNSVFMQNKQAAEMSKMQDQQGGQEPGGEEEGFGGFSDEEIGDIADEAIGEENTESGEEEPMQKAVRLI